MGETPDQLTSEIEETRGRLGTHLDELQDKVSPSAIAGRQKDAAKARVTGLKEKAFGSARSVGDSTPSASDAADSAKEQFQGAPLAAGLAAFGLGMVAAALIPASRSEQRAAVQVKDAVEDQAQPLVADAKQAVGEMGRSLKDSATESVQQVKDAGSDAAATVADEGRSSADAVRSGAS